LTSARSAASSAARLRFNLFLRVVASIAAFIILFLVCYILLEYLALRVPGIEKVSLREIVGPWMALASVVVATWVMLRFVDKLPWSEVGLDRTALRPSLLVTGTVIGGFTIGAASLLLLGMHQLRIEPGLAGSWWNAAERSTALLLPAAFFEELFTRGYVFALLRRAAGWKAALITTSVVFGLAHAWNPGADAESVLAVIVAGFFLGIILLVTRSLYAAGLAHFAWNWVMAVALHTEVSGISSPNPGYRTVDAGPDWLTGGKWGPEGGLAAVVAMFIILFYLLARYERRMEWKA
jgi:uncharacterized protein